MKTSQTSTTGIRNSIPSRRKMYFPQNTHTGPEPIQPPIQSVSDVERQNRDPGHSLPSCDEIINRYTYHSHLATRLQMGTVTRALAHVAFWRGKRQLPLHLDLYIGLQNVFKYNKYLK